MCQGCIESDWISESRSLHYLIWPAQIKMAAGRLARRIDRHDTFSLELMVGLIRIIASRNVRTRSCR